MNEDKRKEELFQRLENIKNKNEEQLQAIKDQGEFKNKTKKKLKSIEENKTLKVINKIRKKKKKW